ncbi:RDD family protein [Faecalispora anaeroviscerum]|uniref:RDD family protein n=1 Tax=Faecalispora anaeroviscerum TaxID=2991836 RepID=UPI0024BBD483|nr:RDD family protein [Faecalispora anaeroviscerum]
MQPLENNTTTPGGFFVRLTAYLIDLLLIGTILFVTVRLPLMLVQAQNPDSWFLSPILFRFSPYDIFLYLAASAYFIVMTYLTGATIGKRLMNLRVVACDDSKLTLVNVLYRETIGRYLSSLLFIGYLMIGASESKQGLHDRLCDTQVIYTCKCRPVGYGKASPAYGYGGAQAPAAPSAPVSYRPYGQANPEAVHELPEQALPGETESPAHTEEQEPK